MKDTWVSCKACGRETKSNILDSRCLKESKCAIRTRPDVITVHQFLRQFQAGGGKK